VYFIWGAIVVALIGGMYLRHRRANATTAPRRRPFAAGFFPGTTAFERMATGF